MFYGEKKIYYINRRINTDSPDLTVDHAISHEDAKRLLKEYHDFGMLDTYISDEPDSDYDMEFDKGYELMARQIGL